jgi:hypothetical protein
MVRCSPGSACGSGSPLFHQTKRRRSGAVCFFSSWPRPGPPRGEPPCRRWPRARRALAQARPDARSVSLPPPRHSRSRSSRRKGAGAHRADAIPTNVGALSMTRFRWTRACWPWCPFGLRGRGRRGARFLPGLDGPMGKRAPADRDPVPLLRSGLAEHTTWESRVGLALTLYALYPLMLIFKGLQCPRSHQSRKLLPTRP